MAKAARKAKNENGDVKTVHFSIHGKDLTRLARERLLEDNPGSAFRIASSLIGEGDSAGQEASVAIGILMGTKKLVGENTMELVDEDPNVTQRHQERLDWLYAGRIKWSDGRWYRPVAQVTSYGIRDLTNDRRIDVRRIDRPMGGFINREWHYCGPNEIAPLASCVDDLADHNVIFEACGEPPHWMTPPRDAHEALKQWRKAGRQLEERGHALWYPKYRHFESTHEVLDEMSETVASMKAVAGELRGGMPHGPDSLEDDLEQLREDQDFEQWLASDRVEEDLQAMADMTKEELRIQRIQTHDRWKDLRERTEEEEAQSEAMQKRMRESKLAKLREQILAQAGDDMLILAWGDEDPEEVSAWESREPLKAGSVRVPRAPFLHWAFDRLKQYEHVKPPWQPVSPIGMKMPLDNQYHTDWVIGAGFDPQDRRLYHSPISSAAMHLAWIQQERFSAETGVHVLVDGEPALGRVEHGRPNASCEPGAIVVLPNLHPKYLQATVHAAAVITEEGGETAHLAQVGRERRLPIVRIPGAREKFAPGDQVSVNTSRRTVEHL